MLDDVGYAEAPAGDGCNPVRTDAGGGFHVNLGRPHNAALYAAETRTADGVVQFGELVTRSQRLIEMLELVRCVAPTTANVLLVGENGTGKELVADAVHALSPRRGAPFVKVNCGAIPDELMEAELFGHRRGAFTGAIAEREGLLQTARGGTLLLDEVGEMPLHLQVKLLRVLQERQARPLGGATVVDLDFRLICATNCDLRAAADSGRFRQDLYFRINTLTVTLPPLRERPEDILLLSERFLRRFAQKYGKPAMTVSDAARERLLQHHWPGNVRELEHAIERAVIVGRGRSIARSDLPETIHGATARVQPLAGEPHRPVPLAEVEKNAILSALRYTDGNKRAAAELLGIYRATLYSKLRRHGIVDPPGPAAA